MQPRRGIKSHQEEDKAWQHSSTIPRSRGQILRHTSPTILSLSLTDPQRTRGKLWPKIPQYVSVRLSFFLLRFRCLRPHIGSFADGQLTDALKNLATDYTADTKVRKKVLTVLASWSRQFKDDRSAAGIAGLYRQVKPATESTRGSEANREALAERERESEIRRREKEEAKRKVKEKRLKLEEARSKKAAFRTASSRKQFNFERVSVPVALAPRPSFDSRSIQEKPEVLTAIANASAAANNLVNAITVRLSRFRWRLACSCLTEARQHRERQSGIE